MKTIYIKCLNGNYFEVLKSLKSVCKKITMEKETFIIKGSSPECYARVLEISNLLNSKSNQVIVTTE